MKLNTFLAVNAVVGLVFGITLLVIPSYLLTINGVQTDQAGLVLARLLGAEFIGFNIVTWLARNIGSSSERRFVVLGHTVSETFGFIVALMAKLSGLGNNMFWGIVAIYFIFALGYAYYQFAKPNNS